MARARRKPMSTAKKPTRAEERSTVHGEAFHDGATGGPKPRPPAEATTKGPVRKRTPTPIEAAGRKGGATSHKPARRPAAEPVATPARAPRSTERSARPDRVAASPPTDPAAPYPPTRPVVSPPTHPAPPYPPARPAARRSPKRRTAAGDATPELEPRRLRLPHGAASPLAVSAGKPRLPAEASQVHGAGPRPSARMEPEPEGSTRVMELHWGDDAPSSRRGGGLVQRWVKRGDALLRNLAEHGAARHEYRADLKDGRFVWVDGDGRVSAEARAQVLCSWSRSTSALAMAWADPMVRAAGIGRIEGMPSERDDVDEETAWRIAMEAADRAHAEYIYRVTTPHAWYFLALRGLTFHPERASFCPATPVGLVLRSLGETRLAVESRAEPADVVRDRLSGLGRALLLEAEYAYRGTDWVARLERAGRRLVGLGEQLPRVSFKTVAAGQSSGDWLDRQETIDLSDAIALLEDEWALFVERG